MRKLRQTADTRKFLQCRQGGIAVIFAFTLLPLAGLVGAAIDYGRATQAKSALQAAVDSAVLGALKDWQTSRDTTSAELAANKLFAEQRPATLTGGALTFDWNTADSRLRVSVAGAVPAAFVQLIGKPTIPISSESTATLGVGAHAGKDLEIAVMLDTTGSMRGQKMTDLKAAATELVDILVWDDQGTRTSRMALVPFSEAVNVGAAYYEQATHGQSPVINTHCVVERRGLHTLTDAAPGPNSEFPSFDHIRRDLGNPDRECRATTAIVPLTADKQTLKSTIASMDTEGMTAGHIGTAWAWYTLSPEWSGVWPVASAPAPYGVSSKRKIAVLMTDGVYNTSYHGNLDPSARAVELCTEMKAKGIEVYTIGFALGGNATAIDTLRRCASSERHFYDATNGEALRMAFRDIAMNIAPLRLTN
jgi:Flp pilus assembly protein TadG